MSIRPGSSVMSPRSITTASRGMEVGATSRMRPPSINRSPGVTRSPLVTSIMPALRRWIGGSGVRGRAMDGVLSAAACLDETAAVDLGRLAPGDRVDELDGLRNLVGGQSALRVADDLVGGRRRGLVGR